jgi:hypothetical protein
MRFAYDLVYTGWKSGRNICISLNTEKDECSFPKVKNNQHSANDEANGAEDQRCPPSVYKLENDFRFITIVVCLYTVAFIILVHLTCTFIFLYSTQKTSYIAFLKYLFGLSLMIGILI